MEDIHFSLSKAASRKRTRRKKKKQPVTFVTTYPPICCLLCTEACYVYTVQTVVHEKMCAKHHSTEIYILVKYGDYKSTRPRELTTGEITGVRMMQGFPESVRRTSDSLCIGCFPGLRLLHINPLPSVGYSSYYLKISHSISTFCFSP